MRIVVLQLQKILIVEGECQIRVVHFCKYILCLASNNPVFLGNGGVNHILNHEPIQQFFEFTVFRIVPDVLIDAREGCNYTIDNMDYPILGCNIFFHHFGISHIKPTVGGPGIEILVI